jgi:heme/copper-type cytochrome/quinol oxidase subunit 2
MRSFNMKNIMMIGTALCLMMPALASAADAPVVHISVKGGNFVPNKVDVPADQKIKLLVKNEDTVQAEFESYPLGREQKIAAGEETEIFVGPLTAGEYPFFDDNNPDAKGVLVAK